MPRAQVSEKWRPTTSHGQRWVGTEQKFTNRRSRRSGSAGPQNTGRPARRCVKTTFPQEQWRSERPSSSKIARRPRRQRCQRGGGVPVPRVMRPRAAASGPVHADPRVPDDDRIDSGGLVVEQALRKVSGSPQKREVADGRGAFWSPNRREQGGQAKLAGGWEIAAPKVSLQSPTRIASIALVRQFVGYLRLVPGRTFCSVE